MPESEEEWLAETNLLPVYLIQDKLQSNFKKVNGHIYESNNRFQRQVKQINAIRDEQKAIRSTFQVKMQEMQKKIISQISMELEGRIAIAIGKSINSFTQKLQQKEKGTGDVKSQIQAKLKKIKEELKYEITMENQKHFLKQSKKLQQISKRANFATMNSASKQKNNQNQRIEINEQQSSKTSIGDITGQASNKWQQQHHVFSALQNRIKGLEDFSVNIDKRVYNSITAIKESWQELGEQLLENRKSLTKKFDELRIDFIKLKGLKQFSIAPDKIQDQFKRRLNQKFTDIYQLLSVSLTKQEYESAYQRMSKKVSRHDDDFLEIRKQLAINNEYFTFYANNSNQEDLKDNINQLQKNIANQHQDLTQQLGNLKSKLKVNYASIGDLERGARQLSDKFENKVALIDGMNEVVNSVKERIESLQQFNKFGPDKLEKIHNSLDIDFTATERELIDIKIKKTGISNVEQGQRDLRVEISKIKDQMFLINSQTHVKDEEIINIKKAYKQLQQKIAKVKLESEEAMASRKPWVCLSCDKQDKDKDQVKKESKSKRPQPFKGFPQQKSQKILKPQVTPSFQQRFEVYDKFRQKYLSDTIKLPQIFKQKLRESSTQN